MLLSRTLHLAVTDPDTDDLLGTHRLDVNIVADPHSIGRHRLYLSTVFEQAANGVPAERVTRGDWRWDYAGVWMRRNERVLLDEARAAEVPPDVARASYEREVARDWGRVA